jgi:hypothetical protein
MIHTTTAMCDCCQAEQSHRHASCSRSCSGRNHKWSVWWLQALAASTQQPDNGPACMCGRPDVQLLVALDPAQSKMQCAPQPVQNQAAQSMLVRACPRAMQVLQQPPALQHHTALLGRCASSSCAARTASPPAQCSKCIHRQPSLTHLTSTSMHTT